MSERQRSETMMPGRSPETRRRSGVSNMLNITPISTNEGGRQTFSYRSLQQFQEDRLKEEAENPVEINQIPPELNVSLTASQAMKRADFASNALGEKEFSKRNQSQFIDAGIELSDSDYSFTSDQENEEGETRSKVIARIIGKKAETKLENLKEEKEVYDIYLQCKQYTKEFVREKEQIKRSSGKMHFNLDLLDLLPEPEKVQFEKKEKINPEKLWGNVESKFGEPNCFGVNSTGNLIAIGTINYKIVIFDRQTQDFRAINYNSIQSPITCLEFYDEKKMLFTGYESGAIVIFKHSGEGNQPPGQSGYKRHIKVEDASNAAVTHIRQLDDMKNIIITDKECRLLYGKKIGKKDNDKFTFEEIYMGNRDSFSRLQVFEYFKREVVILTCGTRASVFVHKPGKSEPLRKVSEIGAPKGQKKTYECFPFLTPVNYNRHKIYILTFVWGYYISAYIIKPAKNNEVEIDFKDNLDFNNQIIYAAKFDNKTICLLNEKGSISLYNVQNHVEKKKRKEEKDDKRRRGTMAFNAFMKKKTVEFDEEEAKLNIPAPPMLRAGTMMISIPERSERKLEKSGSGISTKDNSFVENDIESPLSAKDIVSKATKNVLKESITSKYVAKTAFKINLEDIKFFDMKSKFSEKERADTVFLKSGNSQLFSFTKSGMIIFEFKNWIDFLNEVIQKECFMFGLKCINEILDMGDINLRGIPPFYDQMKTDLSPILLLLITKIFPAMSDKKEYVNLMANLSMFILLKAGMGEYIATQLQAVMEVFGFEGQYLNNLRLFYEGSLIPSLPEEKILKILEYLEKKGNILKRNQFLNFLFRRKSDMRDLAYNYSKEQETAFNAYIIFSLKISKKNAELPLKYLYEDLKKTIEQEDKEGSKAIVTKMIWYVYEIGIRTERKYGDLTSKDKSFHVFNTFLNAELIKDIINANTTHYLNCFKFLLKRDLGKQLSRYTEPMDNIVIENKEESRILDVKKSNKYIVYLFEKFDQLVEEGNRTDFSFFLSKICLNPLEGVVVSDDFIKKLFIYVTENYQKFVDDEDLDMKEDDVVMLLFNIYTHYRSLFEGDAQVFNSFQDKSKKFTLIQYEMKKNQKATFALFQRLVTDNMQYKTELFNWIGSGLKRPDDKERMLKVIDEEYIYLIKQDHKNYAKLLESLTVEEQMEYIMKYKPTTRSKLEIFKKILAFVKKKHMENEITNEFKVEYIALLNKHEKARVLPELMTGKYPSSECLPNCINARNHLAIAYIKERLGYYGEALDIYKKRLKKVLRALSRGGRYDDPVKRERHLHRLKKESEMVLTLCKDAEGSEKLLFEYLEFVVLTTERYKRRRIKEWTQMADRLLDYILSTIPSKNFIAKIEDPEYPFVRDEHLMERTVDHFKEIKGIFSATKKVNASDWWDSNNYLMEQIIPGRNYTVVDDPETVGDSALVFKNCEHTYEICKTECKGQYIYCQRCEEDVESAQAFFTLNRLWKRQSRKHYSYPRDLVTQKRALLHELFKGLKIKKTSKSKVNLDKYDREKKKIDDFVNYMSSEAGFSEIDTGASVIA